VSVSATLFWDLGDRLRVYRVFVLVRKGMRELVLKWVGGWSVSLRFSDLECVLSSTVLGAVGTWNSWVAGPARPGHENGPIMWAGGGAAWFWVADFRGVLGACD
jgi:hypothetical protein